jgi:RHS repeat-associated protein
MYFSPQKTSLLFFSFNGKEKDDEVKGDGNSLDFGARIYDSRLGRWLSLDPLQAKYPMFSPYHFVANNPIVFIDPDGKVIVVATKDGQSQVLAILNKAFGEEGNNFCFDENNQLAYSGDPSSFKGNEVDVFNGVLKVMNDVVITNIVFERTAQTEAHGGEATATTTDNPKLSENKITIDPIEVKENKVGEDWNTEYESKRGGTTTNIDIAKTNTHGEPIKTGTFSKTDIIEKDSKASRFFHGLGHVLFPKDNQQENVVGYENKARSIFKKQTENGKYTPAKEKPRSVDKEHKNK